MCHCPDFSYSQWWCFLRRNGIPEHVHRGILPAGAAKGHRRPPRGAIRLATTVRRGGAAELQRALRCHRVWRGHVRGALILPGAGGATEEYQSMGYQRIRSLWTSRRRLQNSGQVPNQRISPRLPPLTCEAVLPSSPGGRDDSRLTHGRSWPISPYSYPLLRAQVASDGSRRGDGAGLTRRGTWGHSLTLSLSCTLNSSGCVTERNESGCQALPAFEANLSISQGISALACGDTYEGGRWKGMGRWMSTCIFIK